MKIANRFQMKQISECAAGELFEFDFQGVSAFGCCLPRAERSKLFAVAIASHAPGFKPTQFEVNERWDGFCLSYGGSAKIELIRDDALVLGDFDRSEWPGAIRISKDGLAFKCVDLDGRHPSWIDLNSMLLAKNLTSNEQVFVINWRIWASESDMLSPGRSPLVTVSARPPAKP